MLQYQIEGTIYEAKSKLLKKERSQIASSHNGDLEMEIPLEVTYSEGGIRVSPRNEVSTIPNGTFDNVQERMDIDEPGSEMFSNQKHHEEQLESEDRDDQEEIPDSNPESSQKPKEEIKISEEEEQYEDYSNNIPESAKKYLENEEEKMKLNINTNDGLKSKPLIQEVARKYLDMRNQFMPNIGKNTVKLATFKVGTVDPVYNRLHTDAKERTMTFTRKREIKPVPKGSKATHPDYVPMNAGERLYQKSRIKKEKMSRLAQRELKKKIKEDEKASFKPQINEFAHKYVKRSYKFPIGDTLREEEKKFEIHKQKGLELKEENFQKEHPFVPSLGKMSNEIMSLKIQKREASVHEQLSMVSPSKCSKFERSIVKAEEEAEDPKK